MVRSRTLGTLLILLVPICLAAACTRPAAISRRPPTSPVSETSETSVTSDAVVLSFHVSPLRARPNQEFSARLRYANTSQTTTQTVWEGTYVRVRSSSGKVVVDTGAHKWLIRGGARERQIPPGGSFDRTFRFRLRQPGRYGVETYSQKAQSLVMPPVRVVDVAQE